MKKKNPAPPAFPGGLGTKVNYMKTFMSGDFSPLATMARGINDVATIYLPFFAITFINHPDHIGVVIQNKSGKFQKGALPRMIGGDYMGRNLLVMAETEKVKVQREALAHFAHINQMRGFVEGVQNIIIASYERNVGKKVNLTTFMKELHLEVGGYEFFSQDLGRLKVLIPEFFHSARILQKGPMKHLMRSEYLDYLSQKKEVMRLIQEIIDNRRRMVEPPFDMLQALLTDEALTEQLNSGELDDKPNNRKALSKKERARLNDILIAKMCLQLFVASGDTGSTGTTMIPLHMFHQPTILSELRVELNTVLGQELPDHTTWQKAQLLQAIMKEDWRRNTPANILRQAQGRVELGGYDLPRNSLVIAEIYTVHHDPRWWVNPHEFNPNRFIEGHKEESRHPKYAYYPFGGGARICLGKIPAEMNGTMINAIGATRYDHEFLPDGTGKVPQPETHVTIVREAPADLPVIIHRR